MIAIVSVDGIDGAGKSTFARRLASGCAGRGLSTLVVRVDDFRRPVDWSRADRSERDLYYDEYYDYPLLERCLRAFLTGTDEVEIPRFDAAREQLDGTWVVRRAGAELIVVEGVFPLRLPAAAEGSLIYLVTSFEEARRRIIARDQAKGRTRAEIERRIDERYFPGQRRYLAVHDPVRRAGVAIDNEDPAVPRVLRLETARVPSAVCETVQELVGEPTR